MAILTWEDAWNLVKDLYGHYALTEANTQLLFEWAIQAPRNARFLELGVCNGRTGVMLATIALQKEGQYVGIDNWSLEGTCEEVRELFNRHGLQEARLIEGNTHTIPWHSQMEFLLIDAGHDEANVKPDIAKYLPFLVPGGVVAFDDYPANDPNWRDSPHWAVKHYADLATVGWEHLVDEGLTIMRKPKGS